MHLISDKQPAIAQRLDIGRAVGLGNRVSLEHGVIDRTGIDQLDRQAVAVDPVLEEFVVHVPFDPRILGHGAAVIDGQWRTADVAAGPARKGCAVVDEVVDEAAPSGLIGAVRLQDHAVEQGYPVEIGDAVHLRQGGPAGSLHAGGRADGRELNIGEVGRRVPYFDELGIVGGVPLAHIEHVRLIVVKFEPGDIRVPLRAAGHVHGRAVGVEDRVVALQAADEGTFILIQNVVGSVAVDRSNVGRVVVGQRVGKWRARTMGNLRDRRAGRIYDVGREILQGVVAVLQRLGEHEIVGLARRTGEAGDLVIQIFRRDLWIGRIDRRDDATLAGERDVTEIVGRKELVGIRLYGGRPLIGVAVGDEKIGDGPVEQRHRWIEIVSARDRWRKRRRVR